MGYNYQTEKGELFTDDGQRMFLKVRDKVQKLISEAGAFQAEKALIGVTGSTWQMLACLDRMVELGEIKELARPNAFAQHRVFVAI